MNDRESLYQFEKSADKQFQSMDVLQLPLRSVLSWIYLLADHKPANHGSVPTQTQHSSNAPQILARASYIVPYLNRCSLELCSSASNAMSLIDEKAAEQLYQALKYGLFCELMPAVRKGYFHVEETENGYSLSHPNEAFSKAEERDVVLGELVIPGSHSQNGSQDHLLDKLARKRSIPRNHTAALKRGVEHYSRGIWEPALLTDQVYRAGLGFSRKDFLRVRAGLMSFADYCLGMASASRRRQSTVLRNPEKFVNWRYVKWAAPLRKQSEIQKIISKITGVGTAVVKKVLSYLTLDAMQGRFDEFGDGYFPPFFHIRDRFSFSPHALKTMIPERNVLYIANKRNRSNFDNSLSNHLEPALVEQAAEIFRQIPGVVVRKNVGWKIHGESGEIDLLALQPERGVALHIQAKATMAPQGARMTNQVEEQTLKAIQQLKRFDGKQASYRDQYCAKAFGRAEVPLTWVSAILTRSSMGTASAYEKLGQIACINLVTLSFFANQARADSAISLANIVDVTDGFIEDAIGKSVQGWVARKVVLFGKQIEWPVLNLNYDELNKLRVKLLP